MYYNYVQNAAHVTHRTTLCISLYLYNSAIIVMDTEGLLLVLLFIVRDISSTGQRTDCSSVQVRKQTIVIQPCVPVLAKCILVWSPPLRMERKGLEQCV